MLAQFTRACASLHSNFFAEDAALSAFELEYVRRRTGTRIADGGGPGGARGNVPRLKGKRPPSHQSLVSVCQYAYDEDAIHVQEKSYGLKHFCGEMGISDFSKM